MNLYAGSKIEEQYDQLFNTLNLSGYVQGGQEGRKLEGQAEAERSLAEFCKQAWSVTEAGTPYEHNFHIDAICEHLEAVSRGEIKRLLINIPPRHMKSLTVSVFWPCWDWIKNPERRWMFASYAQGLSDRDSTKCRRIIQSDWYQARWPIVLTSDQNAKRKFENTRTGFRLATSVGGMATGEGGDIIVCDDPHNVQEAASEAMLTTTEEWWNHAMSTRLNNPKTGAKVIVMQRVHERDLSGLVLSQGGWDHLCLPAEYDSARAKAIGPTSLGWTDPRTEDGELLWPDHIGEKEITELKTQLGSYAAAGQLQQWPAPSEGGIFKREWWRRYRLAPDFIRKIISWDTAVKTGEENAYTVGTVWGETTTGYYLLDLLRERLAYPELKHAVIDLYGKWRPHVVIVEDKSSGQQILQELNATTKIPVIASKMPDGDKYTRACLVAPIVEAGKVYLPEEAPWMHDFMQEVSLFPNSSFVDQVDSLTQALQYLNSTQSLGSGLDLS